MIAFLASSSILKITLVEAYTVNVVVNKFGVQEQVLASLRESLVDEEFLA
jgi:hypothetical protein